MKNKHLRIASITDPIIISTLIVFIVLKCTNIIAWSWWWVLSPIWIGLIVNIIIKYIIIWYIFIKKRNL